MGGGKGSSQPTTTTQIQQIPEWMSVAGQENYNDAKALQARGYQGFDGPRVANFSNDQNQLFDATRAIQGSGANALGEAMDFTRGAAQYVPASVSASYNPNAIQGQNFLGSVNDYMNPYTENVIDTSLATLDQGRLRALNQTGDQAIAAGAFSGSRHGVMEGTLNAQAALEGAKLAAGLRQQGYTQAANDANTDINRGVSIQAQNEANRQAAANQNFQAQNININNASANADRRMQGGAQLGAQAGQRAALTQSELALLAANGAQQQGLAQNQLDANYGEFSDRRNFDTNMLQLRSGQLGATPHDTTTYGEQQGGGSSSGAGWGAALGGGLSLAAAFVSDEREKKDIEELDEIPGTGLNAFSYRYKGERGPKIVGLMAQDVERSYPDAVLEIGGRKIVNPNRLPDNVREKVQRRGLMG